MIPVNVLALQASHVEQQVLTIMQEARQHRIAGRIPECRAETLIGYLNSVDLLLGQVRALLTIEAREMREVAEDPRA